MSIRQEAETRSAADLSSRRRPNGGHGNVRRRASQAVVYILPVNMLLLMASVGLVSGCKDARRHKASEDIALISKKPPLNDRATPWDVSLTLLAAMKNLQLVRQDGLGQPESNQRYDDTLGVIIGLLDQDHIYEQMVDQNPRTIPKDITKGAALKLVAESWTSLIAHYVNGFLFRTLKRDENEKTGRATIKLQVQNPDELKLLDKIEEMPEIANAQNAAGVTLDHNSPEYMALVRSKSLPMGFNVPILKQLSVDLRKVGAAWRVYRISLGPAYITPFPSHATSAPSNP